MTDTLSNNKLTSVCEHVLRTLLYFDIFHYPLKSEEIHQYLGLLVDQNQLIRELNNLIDNNVIFQIDGFYSVRNDEQLIARRIKGNQEATKHWSLAEKKAKFISSFPFMRGVMVSGSLSKNFMDEKSDLDFFIVTEPKRLWIARTIFDFYRKLFIAKKHYKNYCTNYHISFDNLEIEEKNQFTATELVTLRPLIGKELYNALMSSNQWVTNYFPNLKIVIAKKSEEDHSISRLKLAIEWSVNLCFGNQFEPVVKFIRVSWIRLKFQRKFSKQDFAVAFKSKPHVSKVHSTNGQSRILGSYEKKLSDFKLNQKVHYV